MPNTDAPKPDDPKADEPQGGKRADSDLARSYERIRSAGEELLRLDRLVSRMEDGGPPIPQRGTSPEPGGAIGSEAPPSQNPSESKASHPGARRDQPMLLGLAGFLLAICIFGAALASRYGNEARAIKTVIMARWTAPVPMRHEEASEPGGPAQPLIVQAAETGEQPSPPAASSQKETKDTPSTGATPSADRTSADRASADLAQSLETIAHDLASINEKLDLLKSSHEQTLREHADALQQLKTTQERTARDNARIAAQIQALQAQLAALSAKSPAQILKRENDAAPRQRHPVAAAPRPMRHAPPWRPRPYMDEPYYDDLYW